MINYYIFCELSGAHIQGMLRSECPLLFYFGLLKERNAEDVRLKARPVGVAQ